MDFPLCLTNGSLDNLQRSELGELKSVTLLQVLKNSSQAKRFAALRPARPIGLVPGESVDVHPVNIRLNEVFQEQRGRYATTE